MFVQRIINSYTAFSYGREHPRHAHFTVLQLKLYLKKKNLQNIRKMKAKFFLPTLRSREGKEKQNKVDRNGIRKEAERDR